MANPKNTLPKTAAMPRLAPDTKEADAAPVPAGVLAAVAPALPKPVARALFVPDAVGARVDDTMVEREALPR
jgi:hypothetical protein